MKSLLQEAQRKGLSDKHMEVLEGAAQKTLNAYNKAGDFVMKVNPWREAS